MLTKKHMTQATLLPLNAKAITDFPGYFATPEGILWSIKQHARTSRFGPRQMDESRAHKLKPSKGKKRPYYTTTLMDKTGKRYSTSVHHLILLAFVGPCPGPLWNHEYEARHLKAIHWITGSKISSGVLNAKILKIGSNTAGKRWGKHM